MHTSGSPLRLERELAAREHDREKLGFHKSRIVFDPRAREYPRRLPSRRGCAPSHRFAFPPCSPFSRPALSCPYRDSSTGRSPAPDPVLSRSAVPKFRSSEVPKFQPPAHAKTQTPASPLPTTEDALASVESSFDINRSPD